MQRWASLLWLTHKKMHGEKKSPSIQWTHTQTVPQGGVFPALPYKAESQISTPTLRDTGAAHRKMLPAWPGNVRSTRKLQVRRRGRWFSERHPWATVQRVIASKENKHSSVCARHSHFTQLQYLLSLWKWKAWLTEQLLWLFLHTHIYISHT